MGLAINTCETQWLAYLEPYLKLFSVCRSTYNIMGAYCSKPVTEKISESGEYCISERKIIYGATAMQGWRMFMEVKHC